MRGLRDQPEALKPGISQLRKFRNEETHRRVSRPEGWVERNSEMAVLLVKS